MDLSGTEPPVLEVVQDVVQGVPELGEDEQPLLWVVEEPLLSENGFELVELGLFGGILDLPGPLGQRFKLFHFLPDLVGIPGQGYGVQQPLQALPVGVIHLLQVLQVGEVGGCLAGQILGLLESGIQPVHTVFQGPPHGVGAGCEPSLVEGHQEPDGPGPPVVPHLVGPHALSLHELCDFVVEVKLVPLNGEVGGAGDPLGEHRPGRPAPVVLGSGKWTMASLVRRR